MGPPTNLIALRDGRERAEALITSRFAEGLFDAEELERRLEALQDAETIPALEALIIDLVDPGTEPSAWLQARDGALVQLDRSQLARAEGLEGIAEQREFSAVFSAVEQRGRWDPARVNEVLAVCGEVSLDFRDLTLPPGETVIALNGVCAALAIVVPPGLAVRVDARVILSAVEREDTVAERSELPGGPILIVTGTLCLAELTIEQRFPGESGGQARRRRRRRRRALRRSARRKQRALGTGEDPS